MVKNIKVEGYVKSRLERELISKFGNAVYQCPDVKSVSMRINFKDGSSLGFRKDEEEDDFDNMLEVDGE